jgi:tryptophan synthase alpha chain
LRRTTPVEILRSIARTPRDASRSLVVVIAMAAPVASPARLLAKPPPAATGAAATRRRDPRAVAKMIPRATATTTESTKRPVVKTVSIGATFAALKKRGQCAFIPFICAGDPNLDATERAIAILDDEGADVIELGVPYSDPLADGPTIAQAATRALNAGTTLDKTLALLARVTPTTKAPIVLFTYFNPIYQRGFEAFVEAVAKAGAKGLLVPDIPLEETPELSAICAKNGVDLVLLSTPTTPEARMTKIAEASNGFIYLVSVTGVTGVRTNVESRVQELVSGLKKVRSHTGSHTTAFAW